MFGKKARSPEIPAQAPQAQINEQPEPECVFQGGMFGGQIDPEVVLGRDGSLRRLKITNFLHGRWPKDCPAEIIADTADFSQLVKTAEVCVRLSVTCRRTDCPSDFPGSRRSYVDGSNTILPGISPEQMPSLDPVINRNPNTAS